METRTLDLITEIREIFTANDLSNQSEELLQDLSEDDIKFLHIFISSLHKSSLVKATNGYDWDDKERMQLSPTNERYTEIPINEKNKKLTPQVISILILLKKIGAMTQNTLDAIMISIGFKSFNNNINSIYNFLLDFSKISTQPNFNELEKKEKVCTTIFNMKPEEINKLFETLQGLGYSSLSDFRKKVDSCMGNRFEEGIKEKEKEGEIAQLDNQNLPADSLSTDEAVRTLNHMRFLHIPTKPLSTQEAANKNSESRFKNNNNS